MAYLRFGTVRQKLSKPYFIRDWYAEIRLGGWGVGQKPLYAKVDFEDLDRALKYSWFQNYSGYTCYAVTADNKLPQRHRRMHAFIMRVEPGQIVDHANRDGLDNRKGNLRVCCAAENAQNSKVPEFPGKTSRFKGVSRTQSGTWIAQIEAFGERQCLGMFKSEDEAAKAYDAAARKLHQEFARTNEMMGLYQK